MERQRAGVGDWNCAAHCRSMASFSTVRGVLICPLMYGARNELAVSGSWQRVASWDFLHSKANTLIKSLRNIPLILKRVPLLLCALSLPLPPLVAKKHNFFDSGLLYQFCINFRRRRRLSELLNESEQDDNEGVAVSTQEDNHPESPFVLRKSQPQEGNSAFQSGKNKIQEIKNSPHTLL